MKNVKERMDIFFDHRAPSIVTELTEYRNGYLDILKRGAEIRCLTNITKDNLEYSKNLLNLVTELRHFSGLKGGIAVNGIEYMATTVLQEAKPLTVVIYSDVIELVEQGQFIFDAFWNRSTPAQQRIKELEEGTEPEYFEVITDPVKASQAVLEFAKSIQKEADILLPLSKTVVRLYKIGIWDELIKVAKNGAQIRVICPISEINAKIVEEISCNSNIRILNGEPSRAGLFIVDNSKYMRAETRNPDADDLHSALGLLIHSNGKKSVEQFKTFYDLLWKQSEHYEELRNYNAMQKEFISTAAHELRTPVQPILGLAELLRNKATDDETCMMLDVIIKNAKRLIRLEDNVLDVTRIESQVLKLYKERFDLTEKIQNIIKDVGALQNRQKLQITYEAKIRPIFVYADKARIFETAANLLRNAIKFTKEGSISITSDIKDNQAIVTIKDSGSGIHPEVIPRLFEKFVTKSEEGTGLGLFISKSIVEAHGGKIWGENNVYEKGAIFGFSMPLADMEEALEL